MNTETNPFHMQWATPDLQAEEQMVYFCRANEILTDAVFMKGGLWITNQRILFVTHPLNVTSYHWEIRREQLRSITLVNFWIFPRGVRIETMDGEQRHIAIWRRRFVQQLLKK